MAIDVSWKCVQYQHKQEGLAVASIARDVVEMTPPRPRRQCAVNLDRNLKPKLAIMRQFTSVTDRQTDTGIVA